MDHKRLNAYIRVWLLPEISKVEMAAGRCDLARIQCTHSEDLYEDLIDLTFGEWMRTHGGTVDAKDYWE